jgi:hypothetical protein
MKSPFPGMDPYIEACRLWGDFHSHLIERTCERLADAVPEKYVVRTGERCVDESPAVIAARSGTEKYTSRHSSTTLTYFTALAAYSRALCPASNTISTRT